MSVKAFQITSNSAVCLVICFGPTITKTSKPSFTGLWIGEGIPSVTGYSPEWFPAERASNAEIVSILVITSSWVRMTNVNKGPHRDSLQCDDIDMTAILRTFSFHCTVLSLSQTIEGSDLFQQDSHKDYTAITTSWNWHYAMCNISSSHHSHSSSPR